MKLSFIVPVYKPDLDQLKKSIKSLGVQSLKDCEVIFVMDGADKRAEELISKTAQKLNLRYMIVVQGHMGACAARNMGAGKALGEYIVFWDCDCIIEPDAAQNWVNVLDKNKELDFVYSGYKFDGNRDGIPSQPFDPWLLKQANYISTCFPLRNKKVPKWDESLESLQDWDFWLQVVESGRKGSFIPGYSFSTAYPTPESISGKGCTPENWLKRVAFVKKKHGIKDNGVCVTSLTQKHEGIRLAKMLDCDYQDPGQLLSKPHAYKTLIQVGYSLMPNVVEHHSGLFRNQKLKKVIFWTPQDIMEIQNAVSIRALRGNRYSKGYVELLNRVAVQFVEDKEAQYLMEKAGFDTTVLPMPMKGDGVKPLPKEFKFLVETQADYGEVFMAVEQALPDVQLVVLKDTDNIEDYTGLLHFYTDRSMSPSIKRAILSGRHVISNVQAPLAGYLDDRSKPDSFVPALVNKVRELCVNKPNKTLRGVVEQSLSIKKLEGAIK